MAAVDAYTSAICAAGGAVAQSDGRRSGGGRYQAERGGERLIWHERATHPGRFSGWPEGRGGVGCVGRRSPARQQGSAGGRADRAGGSRASIIAAAASGATPGADTSGPGIGGGDRRQPPPARRGSGAVM